MKWNLIDLNTTDLIKLCLENNCSFVTFAVAMAALFNIY